VLLIDEWPGGMCGNAFAGDQVLVDASFDAARCQLRRLASDGLLGASKYAHRAGITGLIRRPDPRQHCPAGRGKPRDLAEQLGVPGCGCAGTRPVPTVPCSRL
jgi:hypothetical protein